MSIWKFIPIGWLAISVVLCIGSAFIAFKRRHSLSRLIKALDYELWKKYRVQAWGIIQPLTWHFNPLDLPKQVCEAFENNSVFEAKRRKAARSMIIMIACGVNVSLAIVLCIVVWALF